MFFYMDYLEKRYITSSKFKSMQVFWYSTFRKSEHAFATLASLSFDGAADGL